MADKRINALANTASSTASDDFIAVDGTTNGTRKLNAFSPSFGGNATVTGTLTVNGSTLTSAGSLLVNGATSAALFSGQAAVAIKGGSGSAAIYLSDATGSTPGATSPTLHFASSTDGISLRAASGVFQVIDETQPGAGDGALRLSVNNAGVVSIPATTASTTTSSGALVVSGGVGVAGALNGGGLFDFAVSANSTQVYTIQNTSTGASAATRFTLVGGSSSGSIQLYGSGHSTPNILQYASPDTHKWQCNGVERASLSSAGVLSLLATTASTSTSSGALVVSGGVGVAGKVNAGSFTTTGHTTSAVENVNVSTTAVDIAIATSVGAIYFVSGYNNSGGAQGTWLLMVRGTNVTTVSSDNNTGLTVTFSLSSGKLQAATASGTLVTNAYAITR